LNAKKVDTSSTSSLAHNPFAALAAKKAALPSQHDDTTSLSMPAKEKEQATGLTGKIVVRHERKGHGGKTVTLVQGLSLSGADIEAFAREMKKALGCGATVDGGDIVLQGDIVDRAFAYLLKKGATRLVRGS
jgi:translation initiation factor 1